MSTTIKTGWLKDNNGEKFAPKTLTSQVQRRDGTLLEDEIAKVARIREASYEVIKDPDIAMTEVVVDANLSTTSTNPVQNKVVTARINQEETERKNEIATERSERKQEIAVERARINNFASLPAGSTTNDARLEDICVGADGTTYETPGESVRAQVATVQKNINTLGFCDFRYLGIFNHTVENEKLVSTVANETTIGARLTFVGSVIEGERYTILLPIGKITSGDPQYQFVYVGENEEFIGVDPSSGLKSIAVGDAVTVIAPKTCKCYIVIRNGGWNGGTVAGFGAKNYASVITCSCEHPSLIPMRHKQLNPVWLGSYTYPAIDTVNGTITFPDGGAFMYGRKIFTIMNTNTAIPLYNDVRGGSRLLILNIITALVRVVEINETLSIDDVVIGGIKLVYSSDASYGGFINAQLPFTYSIDGYVADAASIKRLDNWLSYDGESVAPPKQQFRYYIKDSDVGVAYYQGMAYYGGYIVRCRNNIESVGVYDAETLNRITTITPDTTGTVHCNTVSFGVEKYDINDTFPLLYCSAEASSERSIWVYRITNDFSTMTLVQKITMPIFDEMPIYWPNAAVDVTNGVLVASGYHNGSHNAHGTTIYPEDTQGYYKLRLPSLNEGDVQLSTNDILDNFTLPAITSTQGFHVDAGRMTQIFGLPTQQDKTIRLGVIDIDNHRLVNLIDLNKYGLTNEPEGLCIVDAKIYVDFGDLVVFSFAN